MQKFMIAGVIALVGLGCVSSEVGQHHGESFTSLNEQMIGPTPYREGGPPIWVGSRVRAGIVRAGKHFDGWF